MEKEGSGVMVDGGKGSRVRERKKEGGSSGVMVEWKQQRTKGGGGEWLQVWLWLPEKKADLRRERVEALFEFT